MATRLSSASARARWRRRVPGVVVTTAAVALAALAFLHPGVDTTEVYEFLERNAPVG